MEIKFYLEGERINPRLFSDVAEYWAEKIHSSGGRDSNKRSQIRKFYDEVVLWNSRAKTSSESWENIKPFVNMLIAKAAYAYGRKEKVSKAFLDDFIRTCIRQVHNPRDLDVFASFFEAFMGYYRQYGEN